jgi:low affinity Fe/Cu permease
MSQTVQHSSRFSGMFGRFASALATAAGSPVAFSIALISLIAWGASGPFFDYSETWQLVINTGTTIVTFMMVFVIQNSQNREGLAVQIKLDEIIRALGGAKNSMIDLECLSEEELGELRQKFAQIAVVARKDEEKVEERQTKLNGRGPAKPEATSKRTRTETPRRRRSPQGATPGKGPDEPKTDKEAK